MSVLGKLASALGRNDERPNVELAEALAAKPDVAAIAELAGALLGGSTAVSNDAIKVLYELGTRNPDALAPHTDALVALLASKNNRNVWGALQAIDTIAYTDPDLFVAKLPLILEAADKGSVIAKDKAMSILAQLASVGEGATTLPIFLDRLEQAAPNQFPMYAEMGVQVMQPDYWDRFAAILRGRVDKFAPSKRARVEKVIRRLKA